MTTVAGVILSPEAVSARTGFATQTLANWRNIKKGPPFFKVGRLIRYNADDLDQWVQAHAA